MATEIIIPKDVNKVFFAIEQGEGAGAVVRRSVGTPMLRHFSPFLMLDHFSVGPDAGFPDHPHRGQETVTYLLQGYMDHEDFAGNTGSLAPGDLQFMTAGRGIVHAEMPRQGPEGGDIIGMQLWVDLPRHLKACEPRYRDLRSHEIPTADSDDGKVHVKVISGRSMDVDSVKDLAYTPVWLLDVTVRPGGRFEQPVPTGWNALAYVIQGSGWIGSDWGGDNAMVERFHCAVFDQRGDAVVAWVDRHADHADEEFRFIVIAGTPLDQPVIKHGPFVLNTADQVQEALHDYEFKINGFERARGWRSRIGESLAR